MMLVLGSGFGLYGHAAALVGAGRPVALPARYREKALQRRELADVVAKAAWVDDEWEAACAARAICLARRPADNAAFAHRLLSTGWRGHLVVEKPVAPDAAAADALEARLSSSGMDWAVPYLFMECDWWEPLARGLRAGGRVAVHWRHRQSPGVGAWKRAEQEGGGPLAFYFIHCLALAEAMCPAVQAHFARRDDEEGSELALSVAAEGGGELSIRLLLGAETAFDVLCDDVRLFGADTPFGSVPGAGRPDPRIPMLQRFHARPPNREFARFQRAVTARWRTVEASFAGL